jgi:leukemia factor-related protein
MDYQQLPPATTLSIGNGLQNQHVQQLMQNSVINNAQIISSMQPPPIPVNNNIPLSVVHNLSHLTGNNNQNSNINNTQNNNLQNSQNLPHPSQILQIHHNNNNNNNVNNNNNNNNNTTEESNRWTQFHHLWRHHAYLNGKSGNSKDICNDDKFKEDGDPWNVEGQGAFLGPNIWDKTLPYDTDLKVTHYADLDEFLSENNIPDGLPGSHFAHSTGLGHRSDSLGHSATLLGLGHITTKRERSPSPSDCVSPDTINPPSPAESNELKDDKYWARRRKNNIAAKRSRDARRQKENQIAMRARYLEKEVLLQNTNLHQELEQLKQENLELKARLSKYQDI